jgi:LPXTG-motif cell wall-anchored protein
MKVPKGTKTKAPVAKLGLESKAKSPSKKMTNRVAPTKPSTQAAKVGQAVSAPKKQPLAKTTSGEERTGKKTPSKSTKKATKEKKQTVLDPAEQNPDSQTLDQNIPGDDSEETNWLMIVLGASILALGTGGLFWYRSKKNTPRIDSSVDLQSDIPGVSNFVSNVTAFEFDAPTDAGSKPERRGKESAKKKGRERVSDQLSLTQADQRMVQETPYAPTQGSQRFHSNPPASGAPSQIVVPKKAKPPAA